MSDATFGGGRDRGFGVFRDGRGAVKLAWGSGGAGRVLAVGLAMAVVAWATSNFIFDQAALAVLSQETSSGMHAVSRTAKLISVLVLFLLAADAGRQRLRWVAAGFVVLGLGQYAFGWLTPLLGVGPGLNTQLYEKAIISVVAYSLFVVGLLPRKPPQLSWPLALGILTGFGALSVVVLTATTDLLPPLVEYGITRKDLADLVGHAPLPGLTGWHFALGILLLSLTAAAAVGAARPGKSVGGWLIVAMVLLAGSQLHDLFWPIPHSQMLSSTRVLYFAVWVTVAVGGILELRRIAAERSALLAAEQERSEHLRELAALKADFTAMVAHELCSPLAAIRGYTDMLSSGKLAPDRQARTLEAIQAETEALKVLVADVQAAASVEREDFTVRPAPVALDELLAEVEAYARTLPGEHPLIAKTTIQEQVLADTERIGQVLRNLLSNAAKYSPQGTPIEVRATPQSGRVRIEVDDRGPGIRTDDLDRIFEKFGRGSNGNKKVAGAGLGLYLSRRIVQAHGGELTVVTRNDEGSTFAFDLEIVR